MVDKTNWLDCYDGLKLWDSNSGDTFSVVQNGNRVTITRTDQNSSWGMNLRFICCPDNGINFFKYFVITQATDSNNDV